MSWKSPEGTSSSVASSYPWRSRLEISGWGPRRRRSMQTVKKAAVSVKETAENIAASAHSGMIKTKAVVQEKVEKMKAKDTREKQMAEERKVERMKAAETIKRVAREQHAAAAAAARGDGGATGGVRGHPAGLAIAHAGHHHYDTATTRSDGGMAPPDT